jgi:hypothetical protein
MDEDRKIRLLPAPILFVASLLLGGFLSGKTQDFIGLKDGFQLIGIIAAGSVGVFAAGYGIGTCTQVVLRLIFRFRPLSWGKSRFHEVALDDDSFERVWEKIVEAPRKSDRALELYAGAVFDHGILKKHREGVHEWLFRRWNGFNTAANSVWPLLLSLPIGHWALGIPWSVMWCLPVLILVVALASTAVLAWHDTMNMAGFMASLKSTPKLGETSGLTGKESASNSGPG